MRTLCLIALGSAVVADGALSLSAFAADRHFVAAPPLERANSNPLDRAVGIGPRFRFSSTPQELLPTCAQSVRAHVNEAEFVDYPSARTLTEFRAKVAGAVQLSPSEAERRSSHESFALSGKDQISGAMCANLTSGPKARGHCSGTISGGGYTIIYSFDPVACRYDNIAVAKSLEVRLSVGTRTDSEPETDCTTKLERFVVDIDDLLAKSPRNILDVFEVLNRYFPLHGCRAEAVSDIMKKSKYFRSVAMNGPKMHVYLLNSETASSRGVSVSFGLTDTGDSSLPFAIWSPPFL